MKIPVLVADDEPLAREGICMLLQEEEEFEVVGECGTGRGVVASIINLVPQIVFLDIQMPEMDGFSALESLPPESMPLIVFTTAYDQYALKAFEVHALDYLLKPIDRDRFKRALQRAKEFLSQKRENALSRRILDYLEEIRSPRQYIDRVVIKNGGDLFFLKVDEINWVEAEGNYVRLHSGRESFLLRETLSNLESQLNPNSFIRIHRSTIVNSDRIRKLEPLFHGDCNVILQDGTRLTLSRNYRKNIKGF